MTSKYENVAKEIIPAVRHALIKELKAGYNKKEEEIAKSLGITQAAVSKYLTGKYSAKIRDMEKKIDKDVISVYAKRIAKGDKGMANECVCTFCNMLNGFECDFSQAGKSEFAAKV